MKTNLFLLICFFPLLTFSQLITYDTYEDYVNKKGTTYDDYISMSYLGSNVTLKLSLNGENVSVSCGSVWGFVYKNELFRSYKSEPCFLTTKGEFCYYENGTQALSLLKNGKLRNTAPGSYDYFSKDINSEIIVYSYAKKKKLKKLYPELAGWFECIESKAKSAEEQFIHVKPCAFIFNGQPVPVEN